MKCMSIQQIAGHGILHYMENIEKKHAVFSYLITSHHFFATQKMPYVRFYFAYRDNNCGQIV